MGRYCGIRPSAHAACAASKTHAGLRLRDSVPRTLLHSHRQRAGRQAAGKRLAGASGVFQWDVRGGKPISEKLGVKNKNNNIGMEQFRLSILHRPVKGTSQATNVTDQKQFDREQEAMSLKAARHQETQDRLLRSLYPTPQDKLAATDAVKDALEQHMRAKEQQR